MQQQRMSKQRFGIVSVLLAMIAFVVIGLVGSEIYHLHDNKKTRISSSVDVKSTTVSASVNPYARWKTATLQYEKATFEYPSSWKLKSTPWTPADTPGIAGSYGDEVSLTSPTNLVVSISTGNEDFNNPVDNLIIISSQPITTL